MKRIRRYLLLLPLLTLFANVLAQNAPAPIKLIQFILTPDAKDWKNKVNQNASVRVRVLKFSVPLEDATISYEIGPEHLIGGDNPVV